MKQLKCEMCGSTDLLKQDGMFVCQTCGTKYSVEEAKKMMIEGTVDVQGTVKVDNSSFVKNYIENARRAMQKEDWEEVEKYYNLVEQNDPKNIEAIFYSSYGKARLSMIDDDIFKRQQICGVLCNNISVIDDNYNIEKSEENQKIISQMNDDLFKMYNTSFVYTKRFNGYFSTDNRSETYLLFAKMAIGFIESLKNIIKIDDQIIYWKLIYSQYKYLSSSKGVPTFKEQNNYRELALNTGKKIQEKDPSFKVDETQKVGCYVATCVYGSYDCPEVWTLRRYRDSKLGASHGGRAFIRLYYAISPTLVKWFGNTNWFKKMWRGVLDKKVKKLQAQGYESTPYDDIDWRK